ncbi:HAD family hydrolase [mine drainage metagenome]|uniref:HAD family hydrolase n=1 Tax=mine drainage metagenome TaxID=410659 RepID=T0YMV9_9ZZZZ
MTTPVAHALKPSAQRIEDTLASLGLVRRVVELDASTRTALDAAKAVGCEVSQIAKSLVFRSSDGESAVLVITSGANRVDENWMARFVGHPLLRADPEFVRRKTGFSIGGVPALGHSEPLKTFIDRDLLLHPTIWAAAGHPNAVCRLTPGELLAISPGQVVSVSPDGTTANEGPPSKWVTFDCYGTLIDWATGIRTAFSELLGVPPGSDEVGRLVRSYDSVEQEVEREVFRSYRETLAETTRRLFAGIEHPLDSDRATILAKHLPSWTPFPEVQRTLGELRDRGWRLGVLSNVDPDLLAPSLRRLEVPFDLIVTSEAVQSYKPAPAHWVSFLKQAHVSPRSTVHVGAGFSYDIPPALRLGFRAVWVNRNGQSPPSPTPSAIVPSLSELPSVIDALVR